MIESVVSVSGQLLALMLIEDFHHLTRRTTSPHVDSNRIGIRRKFRVRPEERDDDERLISAGIWRIFLRRHLRPRASNAAADSHTGMTRLGRAIAPLLAAHPGLSGVYALANAREAFAARMLLAQTAQRTLDVQYYIWRQDMSGTLLFDALLRAADRGVRVRLLLDDINTTGLDKTLAMLDSHPNMEVRLFNPFTTRRHRWLGYLTDFSRLNRRMHNKSFTADNQVTIVGGRNVGDEYFDATTSVAFVDLDVMAIGPVVLDVSSNFNRYWASDSVVPVGRLLPQVNVTAGDEVSLAATRIRGEPRARAYLDAVRALSFVQDLGEGKVALEWAATLMVSDDPAKGLDAAHPKKICPPS